eukprot:gene24031-9608_t
MDTVDMHADKSLFHPFDKFTLNRLREIFIKQDNLIHGRFLAELTQEVLNDLEASKYQHAELRISIYGRKIPRLYNVYRESGIIDNFQQMLDNIFEPLFEVTRDPSSHPQLHVFLSQVVGFDMVDDESKPERRPTKHCPPPSEWDSKHNCAYSYYAYYIYANLYTLNKFRESRGLNTFTFRPHAGEAGDIDHLVSAFVLCENIAHGINLRKSPFLQNIAHGINLRKSPYLQYMFYLTQIGLCMSPLSNNSLFLDYHRNPFPVFFARGLSCSLSTDDPLQIHLTREPLVEEYSVAASKHWVGEEYWRIGPEGNDVQRTNVPDLRHRYRHDTYADEMRLVMHGMLTYKARKMAAQAAALAAAHGNY